MLIRDRIKEFRRVRAADLRPNPKNWRKHPQEQHNAIRGILAEIGYVDAVMAREMPDGSLMLIDGHLRTETTPDAEVPTLIVDLTDEEADKVLATFDPVSSMAEADPAALESLLREVDTWSEGLANMLEDLGKEAGIKKTDDVELNDEQVGDISYRVIVEVKDENDQEKIITLLEKKGYKCLPLMS